MSTWHLLAELSLIVEDVEFDGRELGISEEFTRLTTRVLLRGAGHEGIGEDVVYDAPEQREYRAAGARLPLAGTWTLASFSAHLGELDLFQGKPPQRGAMSQDFRRWGLDTAALDLALRQVGAPLHAVVGTRAAAADVRRLDAPRPAGRPGAGAPHSQALSSHTVQARPDQRWERRSSCDELAATGAVDSLDFKGFYRGTPVDVRYRPGAVSQICAETFPHGVARGPRPHRRDAAGARSRTGTASRGTRRYTRSPTSSRSSASRAWSTSSPPASAASRSSATRTTTANGEGIGAYGGGQTELAEGRGQIQYLAALFHPDAPNDTAPTEFNFPDIPPGLPETPLDPAPHDIGFRWG